MNESFIRNRITELRMKKDVSEYQMSLDLGQNKGYIQAISSGHAMPSMKQFLNICNYFEITPIQFFDSELFFPKLIHKAITHMKTLNEDDMELLIQIIERFQKQN